MATVTLTASFPGSHVVKPGVCLLLDNPEAEETVTPGASFTTPDMELTPDPVKRLLLIQYDDEIQVAVTKADQAVGDVVPITLRTNGAALASYAMMLNGSTVNVYVKDA